MKRLFLFLLLLMNISLHAHEDLDSIVVLDSIQELNEVVVSGNKYKEVIPSQRLSGEELERLNSHSVASAISFFSGVQMKDYGGIAGIKTIDVRSMGTNHLGIFYDGIQLGNAQNGQVDLGKFSMDNVEEISLFNGQKSDIFQSAKDFASASAVYIRTRRPYFRDGKTFNLRATMRAGSFDALNPSVLYEQKITENISASANIEYTKASGKYKFRDWKVFEDGTLAWDTTAIRQNGDVEALRLEGGFNGWLERGRWNIKGYYYDSERGIPGAIVNNVFKSGQRQWDKNLFIQGSFQKEIVKNYELMVNSKYARDKMHYMSLDTALLWIDNSFDQQEFYISLANKYSIKSNWDVSLSADYIWNGLDADLTNFPYPERNTLLVSVATAFEYKKIKLMGSLLGTFVDERINKHLPDESKAAEDKTAYSPSIYFSYKPFEKYDFNIRAFYKNIFRMPTFNDLYYTDLGSVYLKPEYTTQYNLGIEWKTFKNKWAFQTKVDVYYIDVKDKIIAMPKSSSQYRWMMVNLGKVEIRGLDLNFQSQYQATKDLTLRALLTYTYQKAQDFSEPKDNKDGGSWGGQIPYIPWHSGSLVLTALYKTWDLNYNFMYVGERYDSSANIRENYRQPWYTSDLSLGKTFKYKKLDFKLTAEVNNVLDQQYDVIICYPMPGRNYRLTLKINI